MERVRSGRLDEAFTGSDQFWPPSVEREMKIVSSTGTPFTVADVCDCQAA
jgi:hypothetical protein